MWPVASCQFVSTFVPRFLDLSFVAKNDEGLRKISDSLTSEKRSAYFGDYIYPKVFCELSRDQ